MGGEECKNLFHRKSQELDDHHCQTMSCASKTTCATCATGTGCGWCSLSNTCVSGLSGSTTQAVSGPCAVAGGGGGWTFNSAVCPAVCSNPISYDPVTFNPVYATTCATCTSMGPGCGWCPSTVTIGSTTLTGSCLHGGVSGPTGLVCGAQWVYSTIMVSVGSCSPSPTPASGLPRATESFLMYGLPVLVAMLVLLAVFLYPLLSCVVPQLSSLARPRGV
jgi:hypothetical protein